MTISYIFSIYSIGWNILATSGQISLGHAAFYGLGAYASALLALGLNLPAPLAVFIGPAFAGLLGILLGLLCLRLREWLIALVTFGFAVIVQTAVSDDHLRWLTNGWDGLFPPPLFPEGLGARYLLDYYAVLTVALSVYLASKYLLNSSVGLALKAIHGNELLARSCGIQSRRYKLVAFLVSSYISGLSGALHSHVSFRFVSPEIFVMQNSLWPVIFSVLGGIGTVQGPVLGSVVIWLSWESFRSLSGFYGLLGLGIFLGLMVIFLPNGLASLPKKVGLFLKERS